MVGEKCQRLTRQALLWKDSVEMERRVENDLSLTFLVIRFEKKIKADNQIGIFISHVMFSRYLYFVD